MRSRAVAHPTLHALAPIFTGDLAPRARLEAAMPLLDGTDPATAAFSAAARAATRANRDAFGIGVRSAARLDGATIAEAQQYFGAFNPTRRRELTAWQFETMAHARIDLAVAAHVSATLELLDPGGDRVAGTWVFPADHANAHTMLRLHGLEAWGDLPDGVAIQLWPTPGNVARLGPIVTRAAALGTRSALAWPTTRPPSLADHLVREGIAALAVGMRFPGLETPWAAPFTPAPDWADSVESVATAAGVARYADLPVNVYGTVAPAGDARLPRPTTIDANEAEYTRAVLQADLHATDPARIAGYLYGDAVVALAGHPPVGVSPFAGIAVAHAIVADFVRMSQLDLPTAMRLPSLEVLDGAFQ